MKYNTVIGLVSKHLADELVSEGEMLSYLDRVVDDINAKLNSTFPTFSEWKEMNSDVDGAYLDYTAIPDKYIRTVVDHIAKYYVLLGGCDVLCFTAGIGENSKGVRAEIIEKLECLGFKLDAEANNVRGELRKISAEDSSSLIYILPTDEELMIARDTYNLSMDK